MKKAALHNLGCKVNAYETEAMQQLLEEAGYEIVSFVQEADVYVINTCSVTNMADRKSRQMVHRARRQNPNAIVIAAGCYVQTAPKDLIKDGMADIILGNNKKKNLISVLEEYQRNIRLPAEPEKSPSSREAAADLENKQKSQKPVIDYEDLNHGKKEYEQLSLTKTAEHTRAFIKIQDGCSQFCSYCIIPYARGRVRSRQPEDVLSEIRSLAEAGYKEVVLTGIHLSSYGIDFEGDSTGLLQLIENVHRIEGIRRIRLGSLEPGIITEEFASALAGMEKICPHFHLSLQSGCDTVLRRMNRRYDTAEYAGRCEILRRFFLHPAITTDVIVGFPGETEEEFAQTEQFLEQMHFYEMHIFKYSKREGTKAAQMEAQVPEPVKAARSARLIALGERMSIKYRDEMTGRTGEALLEEPLVYEEKLYYTGYTKEYVKIAVECQSDRSNAFVRGKIIGCLTHDIYLMVEI